MSIRVLIIDDEAAIRRMLRTALEADFSILEAATGIEGLKRASDDHPHIVILDLGLPDIDGIEVLRSLRAWTRVPVLVLTVVDEEAIKVQLLDEGADDYLTKPFSIPELMARIRVALRHNDQEEATPLFKSGDLEVDLNRKTISVGSQPIRLTATEFRLLAVLIRNQGRIVSQAQLLTQVWGPNALEQTHYLRIYIGQLRKKIERDPALPTHIQTEPGVGYWIE